MHELRPPEIVAADTIHALGLAPPPDTEESIHEVDAMSCPDTTHEIGLRYPPVTAETVKGIDVRVTPARTWPDKSGP